MHVPDEILDGVRELITIGVGRSAGMLNRLTNAHVTLTVPDVRISEYEDYPVNSITETAKDESTSQVILKFSGDFSGSFSLIISHSSALNLVAILTGEEGSDDEMDALRVETLLEVGNIIISSVMSSLSILLTTRLSFQYPSYYSEKGVNFLSPHIPDHSYVGIIGRTYFEVQQKAIEGEIFILLTRDSYEFLAKAIRSIMEEGL